MVAQRDEIIAQARKLVRELVANNIKITRAILFGSYARGSAREDSDIDVALVSDAFEGVRFVDRQKIIPYLVHYDCRFDVHPYSLNYFNNEKNWFAKEIIKDGFEISL
jgi:predicted nucleotidyltransferase